MSKDAAIPMERQTFYAGKSVARVEWWLHECDLPQLVWARLRIFDDGSADACWSEGGKVYGFGTEQDAANFFLEDEYCRLHNLDAIDEKENGMDISRIVPPTWRDPSDQEFEYLGRY